MAERALLSPQVEKARYALLQYQSFLNDVIRSKEIDLRIADDLQKRLESLLSAISSQQVSESKLAQNVQGLIDGLNARLILHNRAHLFPLFPQETAINQVQNHIIAFEMFLNYRLLANEIPLDAQNSLFYKAMILWRDVGVRRTPKEAMVELANLTDAALRAISEVPGVQPVSYPLPTPDIY